MTLPGPENGHLRMPNWLVERLARLRLNGTQWQILWAVWRRTLCWQEKGHWGNRPWPISTGDIAAAIDINLHQVKRGMSSLVDMNIILRDNTPGGRGHKPVTSFNLDPTTWKAPLNSSEIATLTERVTDVIPITEPKGSNIVTPTMEEVELKGSGLVPPSVADSLPFTDKSATLSVPNSKLLNKHIKKQIKKQGGSPTDELKILNILRELKGWRYIEADDLAWLRELTEEFTDFNLSQLRICRDHYSERAPPKHKGIWKKRLRNWMLKKAEFERKEQPGPRGKSFEQYMKEQEEGS